MVAEQDKWDIKYRARPLTLPNPIAYIKQSTNLMLPGRVLDVASGDGAAALYLAKAGFKVTAVDISSEALSRLELFAQQLDVEIYTHHLDLNNADSYAQLLDQGPFENIVITRYKPSDTCWNSVVELLADNGRLFFTSFNMMQHSQNGFNKNFCLAPGEFTAKDPRLHLLYSASIHKDGNFLDEYLFEKRTVEASR